MPTLKIWESVRSASGLPVIRLDERVTYQTVAFTGVAAQSAAFDGDSSLITVHADTACAVRVGANPTAVVTDYPLAAFTCFDFEVQPGQKLSVIAT